MGNGEILSLQEAARRLGVHYMTAYRYVRTGRIDAVNRDGRWEIRSRDVERLRRTRGDPQHGRRGRPDPRAVRARLTQRLLAGDEAGAWAVTEAALTAGTTPQRFHVDILGPSLRDVGARWERGRVGVADEHRASVVAERLVARLGPRFRRRGRARGTVVVCCAPGERHALATAILADLLRGGGFDVVDLGGDTPTPSLVETVAREPAAVAVCVSVSTDETRPSAKSMISALRRAHPELTVLAGGAAVGDDAIARRLGAHAWAPDGLAALEILERLR